MNKHFEPISELMKSQEAYAVYKSCMYMPTVEKYKEKVNQYLSDEKIRMHACFQNERLVGIIVISLLGDDEAEIIGISVDGAWRSKGIGAYMIQMIMQEYSIRRLVAETDDDAVAFYRKCGFQITELIKEYGGKEIIRYRCEKIL